MLETANRDGRARILTWSPADGQSTETPTLIVPDTKRFPAPAETEVVLRSQPTGAGIELISNGTWFHPNGATDGLVIAAPQPGPSTQLQMIEVGEDVAVWHDAVGWASNPQHAVAALIEARTQATAGRAMWAPGLGTPASYAMWVYLGVDMFDASALQLAAIRGEVLTTDGPLDLVAAEDVLGIPMDQDEAWKHNLAAAQQELRLIRRCIRDGTLRALVERRILHHPAAVSLLRRMDAEHAYLESNTPVTKTNVVQCMTVDSLWMPEVERFRRNIRDKFTAPESADVLVILPCSARKPYKLSKSHRYFARALDDTGIRTRCHEVMITSPMGIVPRELEDVYPANRYDVPVTGHWTRDEEAIIRKQVASLLANHEYKHVVAHVPASTWTFIRDLLPENALHTCHGKPASIEDCTRLRDTLRNIRDTDKQPNGPSQWSARKKQDLQGLLSMQFGPDAAAALVADAKAHGKVPYVKLSGPDGQLGMTAGDRGWMSLTLRGAAKVAPFGVKQVQIQDFPIRKTGSLFAVGVNGTTADIRPGDEVLVMHGDELRAVGHAEMSGEEMVAMKRGIAVKMRHIAASAKGGDE